MIYPKSIATLIEHFQKFPSVGPKSAQRMAFYLLRMPEAEIQKFAQAILDAKEILELVKFVLIYLLQVPVKSAKIQNVTALQFVLLRKLKI